MRTCIDCGRIVTNTRNCPCRTNRYGTTHQTDRATWAPLVAQGIIVCSRFHMYQPCAGIIQPDEPWALDHIGDRTLPAHKRCNDACNGR